MPIKLVTGLPGSGKSLSAVEALYQVAKEGNRKVYATGIDGLAEGLAEPLTDPLNWESLPDGSLVVVDEAQKYFPARRGDTIPPVRALSEHRHRGFDFILVTQHPSMIDPYVRRLVGEHVHVVRKFGSKVATRYRWGEVVEDVQSSTSRAKASESLWRYPSDLYRLYKSATLHTVKPRLPWQLIAIPIVLVLLVAFGWGAFRVMDGFRGEEPVKPGKAANGKAAVAPHSTTGASEDKRIQFVDEFDYARMHTPRIASIPWSAPIFDSRKPLAEPEVYCVIIEGKPCRCYTEQVTRYTMEDRNCRAVALNGVYNPYRRRLVESSWSDSDEQDHRVRDAQRGDVDRSTQRKRAMDDGSWPEPVTAASYRPPMSRAAGQGVEGSVQ